MFFFFISLRDPHFRREVKRGSEKHAMSGSHNPSPLQEEDDRHLQPPDHPSATASSQSALQKTNSGGREGGLSKPLGLPLRSLLQELGDYIPPGEEPESLKVKEKENSFESPKRESSLPETPFRSPIRSPQSTIPSENHSKSPGRNGAIVPKHLKSMLEDGGSPIGHRERSPEESAVAKVTRMGKMMRVESGVVRREMLRRAEIGLRVSQVALCLVSFSVMAADKTSGWAGDYFDRYLEYRYCFSVNVIAFAYSTFQVFSHIHYMIWKRHILSRPLSYSFDFLLDQVLSYLLMSASSSAATRHDDWVSMFGGDKFTDMLIGSITTSFSAFLAFAISSIISAYKLFSSNP